jgi:hypothetical protein
MHDYLLQNIGEIEEEFSEFWTKLSSLSLWKLELSIIIGILDV